MTSVTPPPQALDVRAAAELRRRRVLEAGEERLRKITSRLRADETAAAHTSSAAALHTPDLAHPSSAVAGAIQAEETTPCAADQDAGGEAAVVQPCAAFGGVGLPPTLPREDPLPAPVDGDGEDDEEDEEDREDLNLAALQLEKKQCAGGLGVAFQSSGDTELQPPGVPPTPGGTPSNTPGSLHAARHGSRVPGGGLDRAQGTGSAGGLDWSGLGAGRLAPEVRRLEAVHGALSATRRPRLGASLLLAVLHAQQQTPPPQQQLLHVAPGTAQPSPLVVFLAMEVFLLAGGAVVLPPGEAPRVGGPGDIGWLSLLSVAGTLVPPARKALTYTRALLAVFVALLDDGAVFVLALLLWRAYLAERGGT